MSHYNDIDHVQYKGPVFIFKESHRLDINVVDHLKMVSIYKNFRFNFVGRVDKC